MTNNSKNNGKIEVIDFYKKFHTGLSVFENISFDISPGTIVSIVGPSGSGKSTLLRCITGLDKKFSGKINIDGIPGQEYLQNQRIAFVRQQYSNFHWLTVYENIATAFQSRDIKKAEQRKIITSILDEFDLLGFETYYINQLSGGMQQRVAVARALVQDTDIMALDEPFGALDMKIRENLQLLFKKVNLHHQKTVLFVTHDIEEAIFLSDKIIVFSKLPNKNIQLFDEKKLPFKSEINTAVKYSKDFVDLRREIEAYILNHEKVTGNESVTYSGLR